MKRVYAFMISLALFALVGVWAYGLYESAAIGETANAVKVFSFVVGVSWGIVAFMLLIGALCALWYALREND